MAKDKPKTATKPKANPFGKKAPPFGGKAGGKQKGC